MYASSTLPFVAVSNRFSRCLDHCFWLFRSLFVVFESSAIDYKTLEPWELWFCIWNFHICCLFWHPWAALKGPLISFNAGIMAYVNTHTLTHIYRSASATILDQRRKATTDLPRQSKGKELNHHDVSKLKLGERSMFTIIIRLKYFIFWLLAVPAGYCVRIIDNYFAFIAELFLRRINA